MRALACLGFAVFSGAVFAQSGEVTPKFGIADVHVSTARWIPGMRSRFSHGRYELRNATMVDLIRTAWGADEDKVTGGPEWLEMDRFDVIATAPPGANPETLRTMLRDLLQDRFRLVAHTDAKDLPTYAITAGKKLQLQEADGSEDAGCKLEPGKNAPPPRGKAGEPVAFECRNMTMAAFANVLPGLRGAAGYLFNYTVVDHTGLQGAWNFRVKWSMRTPGLPGPVIADATTMFDAFEKQLGLKLELAKVSTPVVAVDSVNRQPTANLPEVAEKLATPPMEFEAADVKPVNPDEPNRGASVSIQPGGRIRVIMTLKELIGEAWGDFNTELIVGGPKSAETTRFMVVAKAPSPDLANGPAVWNGVDIDSMRMMLRGLIIDRFQLSAHNEDRLVSGYTLVAGRPKLRKADPANRPGCKEGPGADGKDPRITNPMAARLVTCHNMTLTQFAAELSKLAVGYFPEYPPVLDATGISGRYDMTISFSPWNAFPKTGGMTANTDGAASDPNGAISIFDALSGQLGLKLESRKVMSPVLVIDHVNPMPTEN